MYKKLRVHLIPCMIQGTMTNTKILADLALSLGSTISRERSIDITRLANIQCTTLSTTMLHFLSRLNFPMNTHLTITLILLSTDRTVEFHIIQVMIPRQFTDTTLIMNFQSRTIRSVLTKDLHLSLLPIQYQWILSSGTIPEIPLPLWAIEKELYQIALLLLYDMLWMMYYLV